MASDILGEWGRLNHEQKMKGHDASIHKGARDPGAVHHSLVGSVGLRTAVRRLYGVPTHRGGRRESFSNRHNGFHEKKGRNPNVKTQKPQLRRPPSHLMESAQWTVRTRVLDLDLRLPRLTKDVI